MVKVGLIIDWTGATHKIHIIDETVSGHYVICQDGQLFLKNKEDVTEIKGEICQQNQQ